MTALEELLTEHGVHRAPLLRVITMLGEDWQKFDELVRCAAAPRRSVEELLSALGEDVERDGDALRLRPDAVQRYEALWTGATAARPGLAGELARLVAEVPPPLAALDHVQATPDTVLRRAEWLVHRYDLRRARLLFVGDHDLTSLAVRALCPQAELTVVDVDDRVLDYLDRHSHRTIRTVYADVRFGLPLVAARRADLVFSDPPYTPEGMALFARIGIECLADPPRGRLLLAYGYSSRHPELGRQVQRELLGLGLTFEAILPDFHRYHGAQAIGSAADLYVCQPAARSRKGGKGKRKPGIYTHGPQSVEAQHTPPALVEAVHEIAAEGARAVDVRGPDWTQPVPVPPGTAVALDLTADPGPWLLRALLAVNAERVAVLVPNAHPDLRNAAAQAELRDLVAAKYRLRFLRSTPDNTHAVVVADAVEAPGPEPDVHAVWTRAHGRLTNVAAEATDLADHRLVDLPRHRLRELHEHLASVPGG